MNKIPKKVASKMLKEYELLCKVPIIFLIVIDLCYIAFFELE